MYHNSARYIQGLQHELILFKCKLEYYTRGAKLKPDPDRGNFYAKYPA